MLGFQGDWTEIIITLIDAYFRGAWRIYIYRCLGNNHILFSLTSYKNLEDVQLLISLNVMSPMRIIEAK